MNKNTRLEPWTVGQIYLEMIADTTKRRENWIARIRKGAIQFSKTRKLTPGEESILKSLDIEI